MVHGDELDLIEIRHLAQFLGDADFVLPVHRGQRRAGNRHVLVVIHGEIGAFAIARAQRSHAQHIGDELNSWPFQVQIMGQEPESRCAS